MQTLGTDADAIQLPLRFDPSALHADLARIPEDRWIRHFVADNYEGDWSGVALRGPANVTHPIQELFANPGTEAWENTSLYNECRYFAEVMSTFQCNLLSVRLLRLGPGSIIKEHVDHSLSFEDAEVRLHVPVQTNPDIEFWLNDILVPMQSGECWYLRLSDPHRIVNSGPTERINMSIDMIPNDWVRSQLTNS